MQSSPGKSAARTTQKQVAIPARFSGEMLDVLSDIMSVEHLDRALQEVAQSISELFSIKTLVVAVLDENEQVFRPRATFGFEPEREKKIKKLVYNTEKMARDLAMGDRIADNVYLIRPGPDTVLRAEEPFYGDIKNIRRPRGDNLVWHELDYLLLLLVDRRGGTVGYIEIDEPLSGRVPDNDTIDAMRVFARLASVAIENAKLYQSQVEIATRSRYLGDIIAHDINNFNQAVTSYIQMALGSSKLPEKASKYLDRASKSAWGISQLIQRANKLIQIEEEGAHNLGPVDLGEVLRETVGSVSRNHADKDLTIDLRFSNHRYFVTANQLCTEIFENILTNAVEYDPHDKVVVDVNIGEMSTETRRYWCVSVADNGVGIPDSKKNIVFGRFSSGESGGPGSGLGLSIVRAIVEAYKGMVWVEDRVPGESAKGCIFRVALPVAASRR